MGGILRRLLDSDSRFRGRRTHGGECAAAIEAVIEYRISIHASMLRCFLDCVRVRLFGADSRVSLVMALQDLIRAFDVAIAAAVAHGPDAPADCQR